MRDVTDLCQDPEGQGPSQYRALLKTLYKFQRYESETFTLSPEADNSTLAEASSFPSMVTHEEIGSRVAHHVDSGQRPMQI
ncbi:hypothetical protein U0070_010653 [Myodes glareolus]|uniref:Uncharacterized protein n=1 Tax=Myodes glareolus TaxID=447135 RepID=A0AAW0H050_MYOGA